MAFIIVPIDVLGTKYCCDPALRRTTAILSGEATELAQNEWKLFEANAYGDSSSNPTALSEAPVTGIVTFGVCCATGISFVLSGNLETYANGFDVLEVALNGNRVAYYTSAESTTDAWQTTGVSYNLTVELPERPCGNVIQISGSTRDDTANNGVWWKAKITSIS
jgi:hypothetical protein